MFFDREYRKIGSVQPQAIQEAIASLPQSAWFEETGRQEVYPAHRKTQTIPLIFDPDMRHARPTYRPMFDRLHSSIAPVMDKIAAYYADIAPRDQAADPYFVRIILTRLGAGQSIGSHRDHGYSMARAHRIHYPIFSNPKAEFGIAGHIQHLPPGEIWEINNRKLHAVRNLGEEERIHLILDYVIPGERITDPDEGELIA
jgi:hypothetical protein